jgi:hypothetical protein
MMYQLALYISKLPATCVVLSLSNECRVLRRATSVFDKRNLEIGDVGLLFNIAVKNGPELELLAI